MRQDPVWLATFPLPQAARAVQALIRAWRELAAEFRPDFNPRSREPQLTIALTIYLRDVVSDLLGLMGYWGAEDVNAEIELPSGRLVARHRTDIHYVWNDQKSRLKLVFEFKKLNHTLSSRAVYLGEDGILRFITGNYSKGDPAAVMTGILIGPYDHCVLPLAAELQGGSLDKRLQMKRNHAGECLSEPSALFPGLTRFDTEHVRHASKAPPHGTIRVSHLFLEFGYETKKAARRSKANPS